VDPRQSKTTARNMYSMEDIITKVLMPLVTQKNQENYTNFVFEETESVRNMLQQLKQDCPSVMQDKGSFLRCMGDVFDTVVSTTET
jgi:hypothetical protein